jgi:hypothetical protein
MDVQDVNVQMLVKAGQVPPRLLPGPYGRPQDAFRLEGTADLLDPLNGFPFRPVPRQSAGDQVNGMPLRRQPGTLLKHHPLGAANYAGNRNISAKKYIQYFKLTIKDDFGAVTASSEASMRNFLDIDYLNCNVENILTP